jgi:glycosyltransferase involved in cell wall biosynthesis
MECETKARKSNMSDPLDVAVVIPTYNRANYLPDTLKSIFRQTRPVKELIIVDDGSTDDTEKVLEQFGSNFKYIKIRNSGQCTARNIGVRASKTEWIAFCDSDDLWKETKLEKQFELIRENKELEYCFTNFSFVRGNEWSHWKKFDDLPQDYWPDTKRQVGNEHLIILEPLYKQILRIQPIFVPTIMMKRVFYEKVGGFNEKFSRTATEDFEFTLRCVQEYPLGVTLLPLVGVRIHGEKHSGDPLANALGQSFILQYALENHREALQYAEQIKEKQLIAHLEALWAAFERKEFNLFNDIYKRLPKSSIDARLFSKSFISRQPKLIRSAILNTIRMIRH